MELEEFVKFCKSFHSKNYDINKMKAEIRNLKWKPLKTVLNKNIKNKQKNVPKVLKGKTLHENMKKSILSTHKINELYESFCKVKLNLICNDYEESLKNIKQITDEQPFFKMYNFFKTCQLGISLLYFNNFHREASNMKKETKTKKEKLKDLGISDTYARKLEILGKLVIEYPKLKFVNWSFDKFYKNRKNIEILFNKNNTEHIDIQKFWKEKHFEGEKTKETLIEAVEEKTNEVEIENNMDDYEEDTYHLKNLYDPPEANLHLFK